MDYRRFERLVLLLGGATILGSALVSAPAWQELAAHALLFGVLLGAVHWGRRMGFIAATAASLIYITASLSQTAAGIVLPIASIVNLVGHVLAFGLVGIVAGEACGRIKYSLATLAGESAIDKDSGVFNQRYAARALMAARGRFTRYQEPFSVVSVRLAESLWAELPHDRRRLVVRTIAAHLRSDVRLVDEVARLDDGSFMVILPHTVKAGGEVVAERAAVSMRRILGATDRAVQAICYGGAEDDAWIDAALDLMNSGQHSSETQDPPDVSTGNPTSRSTADATAPSTLKTSTAAPSPHGSTKQ